MEEANLLVTFDLENMFEAQYEVKEVLHVVGEVNPVFCHSSVRGLFKLRVAGDPKEVTRKLESLCRRDPAWFWFTYHWIPIEYWCRATIGELSRSVQDVAERIDPRQRWRMRITKRFYDRYHTQELIDMLTRYVDRSNVDLEHPEKTIRIEIIGDHAAVSLLQPSEHFSVNKVKDEVLTSNPC
jgi:tRNA(Ser,Leu) C12 N-acetylase TAN1